MWQHSGCHLNAMMSASNCTRRVLASRVTGRITGLNVARCLETSAQERGGFEDEHVAALHATIANHDGSDRHGCDATSEEVVVGFWTHVPTLGHGLRSCDGVKPDLGLKSA